MSHTSRLLSLTLSLLTLWLSGTSSAQTGSGSATQSEQAPVPSPVTVKSLPLALGHYLPSGAACASAGWVPGLHDNLTSVLSAQAFNGFRFQSIRQIGPTTYSIAWRNPDFRLSGDATVEISSHSGFTVSGKDVVNGQDYAISYQHCPASSLPDELRSYRSGQVVAVKNLPVSKGYYRFTDYPGNCAQQMRNDNSNMYVRPERIFISWTGQWQGVRKCTRGNLKRIASKTYRATAQCGAKSLNQIYHVLSPTRWVSPGLSRPTGRWENAGVMDSADVTFCSPKR